MRVRVKKRNKGFRLCAGARNSENSVREGTSQGKFPDNERRAERRVEAEVSAAK